MYKKLNMLLTNSIFLVVFSTEIRKRLIQAKIYYNLFCCLWKETCRKLSSSCKNIQLFPVCMLIPPCYCFCFRFFKKSALKEVHILFFSTVTAKCQYQSPKIKLSCMHLINFLATFHNNVLYTHLFCDDLTFFYIATQIFSENLKAL